MNNLTELVLSCRQLREKKAELTKVYETEKGKLDELLTFIENQIRAEMNKAGLKSARTDEGTATLRTTTKYNVKDWDALSKIALEEKDMSFFQRRLSTTRLAQYMDDGHDLPDCIAQVQMVEVSITKPAN